jgi:Tol biopolymer transport system component
MTASCSVREVELWEVAEAMGPSTDSALTRHVAGCATCQEKLASMRRLCASLQSISDEAHGPLPETIGPYRITRLIGEGGMGIVYEAEQSAPRRRVALKVMRAWTHDSRSRKQFKREIEALGRLNHPGISSIYDAGQAETGQPWFVMELVEGRALDEHCDRKKLGIRERLELFRSVLDAVAEAHACGVTHRDLKPANIIVDASGRPQVLDFGLAHVTGADFELSLTLSSILPAGTLPYMSPEQVKGSDEGLDQRTDVYSLGVILYNLATGCHPYVVKGSVSEGIRTITETPPKPPGRVAAVDRELEAIILECLAKDRNHRYPSVPALAEDVDRYLSGRRVEAQPLTLRRRTHAFVLRNRRVAGLAAGAMLLAGLGAAVSVGSVARDDSEATVPLPGRGLVVREFGWAFDGSLRSDGRYLACSIWPEGNLGVRDVQTNELRQLTWDASWEGACQWAENPIWSPDGDRIACAWLSYPAYKIRTVSLDGEQPRVVWEGNVAAWPIGWTREGILATVTTEDSRTLLLIPAGGGSPRAVHSWPDHYPYEMAVSPDGRYLVCSRSGPSNPRRQALHVLDLETGLEEELTAPNRYHDDYAPVWTPDARCVVFASDRSGSVDLWALPVREGRADGQALLLRGDQGSMRPIQFCLDGSFYCQADEPNTDVYVAAVDPDTLGVTGAPTRVVTKNPGRNGRPAWSSDGRYLTFVSERGPRIRGNYAPVAVAREWKTGEEREALIPFPYQSRGRAGVPPRLSPDGSTWAVVQEGSPGNDLFLVSVATGDARRILTHVRRSVRWSRDGRRILCFRGDHPARLTALDVESGATEDLTEVEHASIGGLDVSPDGNEVAWVDDGNIYVMALDEPGRKHLVWRCSTNVGHHDLSWVGDGLVFNAGNKATSLRFDVGGDQPAPLGVEFPDMLDLAVHPDGRHIAFSGRSSRRPYTVLIIHEFAQYARQLLDRAR